MRMYRRSSIARGATEAVSPQGYFALRAKCNRFAQYASLSIDTIGAFVLGAPTTRNTPMQQVYCGGFGITYTAPINVRCSQARYSALVSALQPATLFTGSSTADSNVIGSFDTGYDVVPPQFKLSYTGAYTQIWEIV